MESIFILDTNIFINLLNNVKQNVINLTIKTF